MTKQQDMLASLRLSFSASWTSKTPQVRETDPPTLESISFVVRWSPSVVVSGDLAYGGRSILAHRPPNLCLIGYLRRRRALYDSLKVT
jgi:hypothetical protein